MTAYIIFNVYDRSEFYLWDVTTSESIAIKKYKEKHLLDFYEGVQPDISQLVLAIVQITKSNYSLLKKYLKFDEQSKALEGKVTEFLTSVYETEEYEEIFCEQGDSKCRNNAGSSRKLYENIFYYIYSKTKRLPLLL